METYYRKSDQEDNIITQTNSRGWEEIRDDFSDKHKHTHFPKFFYKVIDVHNKNNAWWVNRIGTEWLHLNEVVNGITKTCRLYPVKDIFSAT